MRTVRAASDAFARAQAAAHSELAGISGKFTALISTSEVDALDNTATTGAGELIYWLGGEKVADDHDDFYDGDWDSVCGQTETGGF